MIRSPQNIKAICHSNPDLNFAKGLSLTEGQINITTCRVLGIHVRKHFHIKIEHGITPTIHSRPRLTLNSKEIFHLLISFSSILDCHVVDHGFCKFNSCQSLQFSLLAVATLHILSSFSQECCFLKSTVRVICNFSGCHL